MDGITHHPRRIRDAKNPQMGEGRVKYAFDDRESTLGFGNYLDVCLKAARERRDDARRRVAAGVDPSAAKKAARAALSDLVKAIALEWLAA